MAKEKIRFEDLSWVLKLAAIGGFLYCLMFTIGFIIGILGAI